jgi:hypothetical protein
MKSHESPSTMQSFEIVGSVVKNRFMTYAGPVGFGVVNIDLSHFNMATSVLSLTPNGIR